MNYSKPKIIEKKWQTKWEDEKIFSNYDLKKKKKFIY